MVYRMMNLYKYKIKKFILCGPQHLGSSEPKLDLNLKIEGGKWPLNHRGHFAARSALRQKNLNLLQLGRANETGLRH